MQLQTSKTQSQTILNELKERPLVWIGVSFICALMFWQIPVSIVVCLFVLVFISKPIHYVVWFAFVLTGILMGPRVSSRIVEDSSYFEGVAVVTQAPRPIKNGERCIVQVNDRKLIAYLPKDPIISWGDELEIVGIIKPLPVRTKSYWRGQGLAGQVVISKAKITRMGTNLGRMGQYTRIGFVQFLSHKLDHKLASIVGSLGLNHDPDLPEELRLALQKTGTIHIISTSGMHVMLISALLAFMLSKLPIPRWLQLGILLVLIVVYGASAGFRPPMMRAIFMTLPLLFAYLFRRQSDGLTTLAFSAIATLLIYPEGVFDIGVILSFISVLGLILFTSFQHEAEGLGFTGNIKQTLWNSLKVSLVATAVTAPITASFFGGFSIIAPIVNLLIAPTIPIIVVGSMFAWYLDGWLPGVSNFIMQVIVEPLAKWLYVCVMNASQLPFAYLDTGKVSPILATIILFFGLSMWRPKPKTLEKPTENY